MQLGYFQVMAEPVSTWVQEIFELRPRQSPRLVTKLKMPPRPSESPGYQFCTVEYLISASSSATSSTTAACSWFSSRLGAVHPGRHGDERAVGEHRRVQRGEEIVGHRHHGAEIFTHQLRMLAQGLG